MDQGVDQLGEIRRAFLAESDWLRLTSPLYSFHLRASAEDRDLVGLMSTARCGQPVGLLFPIVAHYLILKEPDHPLAQFYLSLTDQPDPPEGSFDLFRKFCLERREEFVSLVARRTVNSNLAERAGCVMPCLSYVSGLMHEPMTLIEICCSVGLSLVFDHYHYDYGKLGQAGNGSSPVRLSCRSIGTTAPPVTMPAVQARVGVDLVKVDPSDPLERLWMVAALCPEWKAERDRLKAALEIRASQPIRVLEGDAVTILPSLLEELPGSICVLHSYCIGHFSAAAREQLDDVFRQASRKRDMHRLSIDLQGEEAPEPTRRRFMRLASAGISPLQKSFTSRIDHTWYEKQRERAQFLGHCDGYGSWIDWQV